MTVVSAARLRAVSRHALMIAGTGGVMRRRNGLAVGPRDSAALQAHLCDVTIPGLARWSRSWTALDSLSPSSSGITMRGDRVAADGLLVGGLVTHVTPQ